MAPTIYPDPILVALSHWHGNELKVLLPRVACQSKLIILEDPTPSCDAADCKLKKAPLQIAVRQR